MVRIFVKVEVDVSWVPIVSHVNQNLSKRWFAIHFFFLVNWMRPWVLLSALKRAARASSAWELKYYIVSSVLNKVMFSQKPLWSNLHSGRLPDLQYHPFVEITCSKNMVKQLLDVLRIAIERSCVSFVGTIVKIKTTTEPTRISQGYRATFVFFFGQMYFDINECVWWSNMRLDYLSEVLSNIICWWSILCIFGNP